MLEIGSLIDGKYKILNKIGQGGMSIVYLAMNEKANKPWAVKEVRKDGRIDFESVRQGLVAETNILKKLKHPNLPSIIDVIDQEDSFIIIMDYIEGNSLNKALDEYGAQPQELVIEWAKQLCDVLGYLHTRNPAIIYRDMKPSNIMLKPDGNITLIDFGIAREFKEKNLADTTCLGTPGYAAPEQFGGMGQTDARTDIYCLGATMYHLVTGKNPCEPPYEISPIREVNPKLSGGLEKIILKCTQRNPENRYQSAAELMYDLEHYDEIDEPFKRKQQRKLGFFIASVLLTVIFCGVSVWGYVMAEGKKAENYDYILSMADDYEDYYEAILTDPARTEAYLGTADTKGLINFLIDDGELDSDEASVLRKFLGGLDDTNSNGYSETVDVMGRLKAADRDGYQDVCYAIGEAYLFNYNIAVEKDRYFNAAQWFVNCTERYPIAQVYCDISECLDTIYQYSNAQIKQTTKLYDEYGNLWTRINELKSRAEGFDDIDSEMQVWNLIVDMISSNVNDFLEVTTAEELNGILDSISDEASMVTQSVLQDDIKSLKESIRTAKQKVQSLKV